MIPFFEVLVSFQISYSLFLEMLQTKQDNSRSGRYRTYDA